MLSIEEVQRLSAQLKIDRERIVREFYEIFFLNEISKESWSQFLVFKGGTALRLAYNSPRFSDDIDFSIIQSIASSDVFQFATVVSKKINAEIRDRWEKRNTILVEFGLQEDTLPQSFGIKIEISKRSSQKINSELKVLRSPASPLEALFNVQTLEDMLNDKIEALKSRDEPRDLFDIWYICQKLQIPIPQINVRMDEKIINQVLRKYLPVNWYRAIDEIASGSKE